MTSRRLQSIVKNLQVDDGRRLTEEDWKRCDHLVPIPCRIDLSVPAPQADDDGSQRGRFYHRKTSREDIATHRIWRSPMIQRRQLSISKRSFSVNRGRTNIEMLKESKGSKKQSRHRFRRLLAREQKVKSPKPNSKPHSLIITRYRLR